METSQRVVKDKATCDEKLMSELLSVSTILFNLLNTTNSVSDTIDLLKQEHKIVDLILTNIIEEDLQFLENNAKEIITNDRTTGIRIDDEVGTKVLKIAESMLQIENHNESKVLRYFEACDATNDTVVTLTKCLENSNQTSVGTMCVSIMTTNDDGKLTTDVINFSSIFDEAKMNYISKDINYLKQEISDIVTYCKDWYLSKVESVYKNMSEILEAIPQHVNCINSLHLLENMV